MTTAVAYPSRRSRPSTASPTERREAPQIVAAKDLPPLGKVRLEEVTQCNLCGESEREILFATGRWTALCDCQGASKVAVCTNCGLIYLTATLPKWVLEYPGKHGGSLLYGMRADANVCAKYFRKQHGKGTRAAAWIEQHVGPLKGKRVLDVLSGTGGIVQGLIERGADAEGLEPSATLGGYGRQQHGLIIHQQLLENFESSHQYDVITGLQLLNHYRDPLTVVEQLRALLTPGGVLFTETINFPHALRRKPITSCVHVDHPYMFSIETMRALFHRARMSVIALESDDQKQFEFGSLNHMHVLCRVADDDMNVDVDEGAALRAASQCLASLAEFQKVEFLRNAKRNGTVLRRIRNVFKPARGL